MSQESKNKISESQKARYAGMRTGALFTRDMVAAASAGDTAMAYRIMDSYVGQQGQTISDEDIVALIRALIDNLRDKDILLRALREPEPGAYSQLLQSPSIVDRSRLEKIRNAEHEARR